MRRRVKIEERRLPTSQRWRLFFFLVALTVIQLVIHYHWFKDEWRNFFRQHETVARVLEIQNAVLQVIDGYGIQQSWMKEQRGWLEVKVPLDLPIIRVYVDVANRAKMLGALMTEGNEDFATRKVELVLEYRHRVAMRLRFVRDLDETHLIGQIALIIDDFGYSKGGLAERFLKLPYNLTLSVIPGLPFSRDVAYQAYRQGKEVIVHLPMEALREKVEDRGYTIYVNQSKIEMRKRIREALQAVPHSKGLNNHKGSRATVDETVMSVLMSELERSGYYFVDSRTSSQSIAATVAQKARVRVESNEMFIDTNPEVEAVRQQLNQLTEIARRKGRVVAIGHIRESTYRVLQEEMSKLERLGFRFVTVSELLKE